jgi:outer membrane immunogenic protein
MTEELLFKGEAAAEYDRAFAHVTRYFMPFLLRGPFVIGAFGDFDFGSIKGDFRNLFDVAGSEKETSAWAVGARLGWVALPQLLTYVAGGWTEAHFDQINWTSAVIAMPLLGTGVTTPAHTYNGWFIATGYEYGISFMPGLFWKTEYRFSSYRADDLQILNAGLPTSDAFNSQKTIETIRTELVWRFNWASPVVARY